MTLDTVSKGNGLRWDGKEAPFYEIYYLKLVDPVRGLAFWGRYTLLIPKKEREKANAAVWGIFSRNGAPPIALKKTYPLNQTDPFHAERFIQIHDSFLSIDKAVGVLSDSDHEMRWELTFEDPTWAAALYPHDFLYRLSIPKTKFIEPRLNTKVSGFIKVDQEDFHLTHHPAHQAHIWGTEYATRWVWGNCNQFNEDASAVFEGLVAEINVGPIPSPPLALFLFVVDGKEYRANSIVKWMRNESSHDWLSWQFEAVCGDTKFLGKLTRTAPDIIGVEYQGPKGERRFCHTTMMADMELKIFKKRQKEWVHSKTLTAQRSAAFETVEPKPDAHVKFML